MSTAIQIDNYGDAVLDSAGRLKTISNSDKIVQDLTVLIRSVKGSCPFDITFGIEDLSEYHGPGTKLLEAAVKSALLQYDDVKSIQNFNIEKDRRTAIIALTVQLLDGTIISLEVEL